jgi:hypothetical protein
MIVAWVSVILLLASDCAQTQNGMRIFRNFLCNRLRWLIKRQNSKHFKWLEVRVDILASIH